MFSHLYTKSEQKEFLQAAPSYASPGFVKGKQIIGGVAHWELGVFDCEAAQTQRGMTSKHREND